jgi:hypothetical protein
MTKYTPNRVVRRGKEVPSKMAREKSNYGEDRVSLELI